MVVDLKCCCYILNLLHEISDNNEIRYNTSVHKVCLVVNTDAYLQHDNQAL